MSDINGMTRRTAIASAALGAGAAALGGTQAMAQAGARKTFVLIHGAWHGGWCWRRVADLLGGQGPQGVRAVAHRQRRPLASSEQGRHPRHPHHRHRQPVQMGRPRRTSAWWRIPTAAGRRRARSSRSATACRRSSGSTRSSRRTARRAPTSPPSSAVGAGRGSRKGRARASGAAGEGVRRQRKGSGLGQIEADRPAERRRDAADQAHRRAREDREEDLHPRPEISAGRVRQGAGGMQGRRELEDFRQREHRP